MSARRVLNRIVATTDVHSSFDQPLPMLAYLHAAREQALVVDCGDFFEGSGYYRLGGGRIERQALALLYDVIAPGNHGWRHHFEPDLRALTVSANTIDADTGEPLFRPVHIARIDERRVGVTGVLGEQAFTAIPRAERTGHHVIPPGPTLHELRRRYRDAVDDWIVLSHSGFEHDLALAAACPFVSVIFSGHCHSEQYGPVRVQDTLVVKGPELSAGYAEAGPRGQRWIARARNFPAKTPVSAPVTRLHSELNAMRSRLTSHLGPLAERFHDTVADRHEILTLIAQQLRAHLKVEGVVLNETCLRPVHLGSELYIGDLLAIEPFANQLVQVTLPSTCDLEALAAQAGPLIVAGDPDGEGLRRFVTTQYLVDTYLGERWHGLQLPLAQAVQAVLTGRRGDRP